MTEFVNNFHFLRPYFFLAFVPLIYFAIKNYRQQTGAISHWQTVCDRELLPYLLETSANSNSKRTFWLSFFVASLAIFALAAPTWERLPAPAFRNNSALVIALNLSESMNAQDIKPSRLIRARYKIADLLSQRKDGQTALLVYSGAAFTVTPLTSDTQTINSQLEALTTDIMPSSGNNPEAGMEKAVTLLKQAGLPQGHILLITDNVENSAALSNAKKLGGYRLSVLGVGTTEGAPIALPEGGFAKDESGQILVPKLQTAQLSELATAGNGNFQIMTTDDSDVKKLTTFFDSPFSKTDSNKTELFLQQWEDFGYYLILLILPWAAWQFRKGAFYLALLFLIPIPKNSYALDFHNLWKTPDQQAQQLYDKKQFPQAAEKFKNFDWKAAAQYQAGDFENAAKQFEQNRNFYNLGNALAKKGQLSEALAAYEKAIAENPYDSDAKANKELVEQALKKQEQQKQDSQQNQQPSQPQENEKSSQDSNQKQGENDEKNAKSQQKEEHKAGENPDKKEDSKAEQKQEPESQKPNEQKNAPEKKNQLAEKELTTEQQQANEQWLKRIPDDPATLLKRKFKYQYGQQ